MKANIVISTDITDESFKKELTAKIQELTLELMRKYQCGVAGIIKWEIN